MGGRNLRTRCTPAPFAFSEAVVQSVPVSHARKPSASWVLPQWRLRGNASTSARLASRSQASPKNRCCLAPGRRASRQPSRCGRSMRSRQKQQPAKRRRSRAATFGYQRTRASGLNALTTEGPATIFKRRLAIPVTLLQGAGGGETRACGAVKEAAGLPLPDVGILFAKMALRRVEQDTVSSTAKLCICRPSPLLCNLDKWTCHEHWNHRSRPHRQRPCRTAR